MSTCKSHTLRLIERPRFWLASVLLSALIAGGCAGSGGGPKRTSEFEPLGFPGDDSVITAGVVKTAPQPMTPIPSVPREVTPQPKPDTATVIRVQFYTTTNINEAEDIRRRASGELDVPVSMDFETPYYKLKAGPFTSEAAAEKLVTKLRAMGYESAWVVREKASSKTGNP